MINLLTFHNCYIKLLFEIIGDYFIFKELNLRAKELKSKINRAELRTFVWFIVRQTRTLLLSDFFVR